MYFESTEGDSKIIWNRLNHILWKKMREFVYSNSIVLEAGCGISALMNTFASQRVDVVGIDISSIALRKARKIYKKPNLIQGDINHLPFRTESFDLVYNVGVIEHFPNPKLPLKEMIRVTKLSGTIIVAVPNKYNLWNLGRMVIKSLHRFHLSNSWKYGYERPYTKNELRDVFVSLGIEKPEKFGCGTFEGVYITAYFSFRRFNFIIKMLYPLLVNQTTSIGGKILNQFAELLEKIDMFGLMTVVNSRCSHIYKKHKSGIK